MLRSDKQRRAMFANMNSFSSKAANGYTGIKFSEDPDTFVFDDDIVEEVGESIDIPIEEKPKKVIDLPDLSGDYPDWSDVDVEDYLESKRDYFRETRYAHPTDIGDDKIRKMVEMFKDPSNYYESGGNAGRLKLGVIAEDVGVSKGSVRMYFRDKHIDRNVYMRERYEDPMRKEERRVEAGEYADKKIEELGKDEYDRINRQKVDERYDVFPDAYLMKNESDLRMRSEPEQKIKRAEYHKEHYNRPGVAERKRENANRPEAIAKLAEYRSRPENIEKKRVYNKNYRQRPGEIELERKRHREYYNENRDLILDKKREYSKLQEVKDRRHDYYKEHSKGISEEEKKRITDKSIKRYRDDPEFRESRLESSTERETILSFVKPPSIYNLKKIAKDEGLYSRLP